MAAQRAVSNILPEGDVGASWVCGAIQNFAPNLVTVIRAGAKGSEATVNFASIGLRHDQDKWIYIVKGEFDFVVGKKRFRRAPASRSSSPQGVACVGRDQW
jgi:hypothetical protein